MCEIVMRLSNIPRRSPNRPNLADELHSLRQSDLYANSLPASIFDIPGEKSLHTICRQYGLKQFGNKLALVKSLIDHGLSSGGIVNISGHNVVFYGESSQSIFDKDYQVMDTMDDSPTLIGEVEEV